MTIHHSETTIGGRSYQIEVAPVGSCWCARLQRRPGMPTAMMPFYGATPEEAADQLTNWLTVAHHPQPKAASAGRG